MSVDVIDKDTKGADFLTVMEKGIGKKTAIRDFQTAVMHGQGIKVAQVKDKTGKVVVSPDRPSDCESVILTLDQGQVVKLLITLRPRLGRATSA